MPSATMSYVPSNGKSLHPFDVAVDEERMENILTPMMRERFGAGLQVSGINIEVLRRRTKRCVLRYQVEAFDRHAARDVKWRVIGKLLDADLAEKVCHNMRELWVNGFSREAEDGISIPEVLDFSPSLSMLWQEEVPGLPVRTLLKQSLQPSHLRQVARILVKLHKCPIVPGRPFTIRNYLLRCHPRHEFLSLACPGLAASIDYIVDRAYEIESAFDDIELTPLHGDFHLGQIHLENGHAWLIDFDALCYGDPASDLGNLLVFLKARSKRHPEYNAIIVAFLDEYFSQMNPAIAARIPLYEALTHLRRACKALRLQEEDWESTVKRMIESGVASINEMANY
jgi:tRNA A-37 threonylcarbamoyl transferase component Bud32